MVKKRDLTKLLSRPKSYYSLLLKNNFGFFRFDKPVVLFGAAQMGEIYLNLCRKNKIEVLAYADNDLAKAGKKIEDINIISLAKLKRFSRDIQIIITSIHDNEILFQLRKIGFTKVWPHSFFSTVYPKDFNNPYWQSSLANIFRDKDKILACFDLFDDELSKQTFLELIKYRLFLDRKIIGGIKQSIEREYFDRQIINLNKNEIFVDGGAYDGDTIEKFRKSSDKNYTGIYAFEPDRYLFQKLKKSIKRIKDNRIIIYRLGLGKKEAYVRFTNDSTLGSRIADEGNSTMKVVTIDKFLVKKKISFIKLDIEGAEWETLLGAKKTIASQRPKLAISVYHKSTDLWRIPLLIKKYVPSYTFYLRHYEQFIYGTICYAVV